MTKRLLPGVMRAPDNGGLLLRGLRVRRLQFKDEVEIVKVPGYYPKGSKGEAIHVGDDLAVVDAAVQRMRARWEAKQSGAVPVNGPTTDIGAGSDQAGARVTSLASGKESGSSSGPRRRKA